MFRNKSILNLLLLVISISFACNSLSERVQDENTGMNGSFEIVKKGLPVNWFFYTSKTVKQGNFEILIDKIDKIDGEQSLKFDVKSCEGNGGWHSPGFFNEVKVQSGESYDITIWIKNISSEYYIRIAGINEKDGDYRTVARSKQKKSTWQQISYEYTIPEDMNYLRFEVNLLSPGVCLFDHFQVEKI